MLLTPSWRKLTLAVHIAVSVGWMGALVAYLPLDIAASTSGDAALVRTAYVAMDLVAVRAIVPLALATLATGIVISLGTKWGLFRHYWVLFSLALTLFAVIVLLVETRTIASLALAARDPRVSDADVLALPGTLPHSVGGTIVLTLVLLMNIYKPRGVTRYGWRKEREGRDGRER